MIVLLLSFGHNVVCDEGGERRGGISGERHEREGEGQGHGRGSEEEEKHCRGSEIGKRVCLLLYSSSNTILLSLTLFD